MRAAIRRASPARSKDSRSRTTSIARPRAAWTAVPISSSRRPDRRSGFGPRCRAARGARRRCRRERVRRCRVVRGLRAPPGRQGRRPGQSVRDRADAPEPSRRLGLDRARDDRGPLLAESTACAASNMAIGDARDAIRLGRADVMFCGGTEAPVTAVAMAGFGAMRALSKRNDEPASASRPFDARRDGFVMAEGAAVLVLEELQHATAAVRDPCRGCRLRHLLRREPRLRHRSHGREPGPCTADGLRGSGRRGRGDRLRQRARNVDPARRRRGDARLEARARRGQGPPNAHLVDERARPGTPSAPQARSKPSSPSSRSSTASSRRRSTTSSEDPECDLDYIANTPRREQVEVAVSNSFGFGGHNTAVVFRRWQ